MASRFRSLSSPAFTFLKSTKTKPSTKPTTSFHLPRSSPSTISTSRPMSQIGCLQSLLPLHTAVSSARLTSCLSLDSKGSRSLYQGMLCSASPGV